jgi:quercetin 2,3-dioxygenase
MNADAHAIRTPGIVMDPIESHEAQGLAIFRTIGSDKLVLLDPFLLLDHMRAPKPTGGDRGAEIGFPRHPHRGIETLTYVMAGRVHHGDSLGNTDAVGAGESQWMTAGGGIFHSEMVEIGEEGMDGLQLWVNLPAAQKMKRPAYYSARQDVIPVVHPNRDDSGVTVRVVAGTVDGMTGPATQLAAALTYLDVHLPPAESVTLPAPQDETAFAYVYQGMASFGEMGSRVPANSPNLVIFCNDGDSIRAVATGGGEARFIFAAARPWREPVLQYRSLVMNTVDEMKKALDDLANGTFAWKE